MQEVPGSSPGASTNTTEAGYAGMNFQLHFWSKTIPGGQVRPLPPGVYTDTITVTLTIF